MIFHEVFYENRQKPNDMLFVRQAGELLYDTNYNISRNESPTHCIGFVKKGRLKLRFCDHDYEIMSGQSIFLPHNTKYSITASQGEPPHFLWINLRGALVDAISDTLFGTDCALSDLDLTDKFSRLQELLRAGENSTIQISELIFTIVMEIFSHRIFPTATEDRRSDFELYISNSIQTGFSVTEMAKHFHCSTDTLNRQFRKKFGMTPYAYYQKMRIEIAKTMLHETPLSVDDIAERLHFNDRNHFSLCFKKATGSAPVSYKKATQKDEV